jgi:hypothetical protein
VEHTGTDDEDELLAIPDADVARLVAKLGPGKVELVRGAPEVLVRLNEDAPANLHALQRLVAVRVHRRATCTSQSTPHQWCSS